MPVTFEEAPVLETKVPRFSLEEEVAVQADPLETETLVLDSPVDMHVHFRQGAMLDLVAPMTAQSFAGALIMPNIMDDSGVPILTNTHAILAYYEEIMSSLQNHGVEKFEPYMTLFMRQEGYKFEDLQQLKQIGIIGSKYYPRGMTTNSHHGVFDWKSPKVVDTFKAMADLDLALLVHPETDGFVLHRERDFLDVIRWWHKEVPSLRIVVEHITTADAVSLIQNDTSEKVTATITAHHLMITLNDVVGGLMMPHNFCKPIAKMEEDKAALRTAAFSGSESYCLGTDSAPHPRHKKECCGCAAGCFTAPIALQLLAGEFLAETTKKNYQKFVCYNARSIYGINPPEKKVTLQRKDFEVPEKYTNGRMDAGRIEVVPFKAGETLEWSLK